MEQIHTFSPRVRSGCGHHWDPCLALYVVHPCSWGWPDFTRLLAIVWVARKFNVHRVETLAWPPWTDTHRNCAPYSNSKLDILDSIILFLERVFLFQATKDVKFGDQRKQIYRTRHYSILAFAI